MALTFNKLVASLDNGLVLSPERYHPAKYIKSNGGIKLSELVYESRETVSATKKIDNGILQAIVLDTSEASNGFLNNEKMPEEISTLGSTKKIAHIGDVIISRLRPYLRQVAYVDETSFTDTDLILTSTEYLILRPIIKDMDISFLVPYLLSSRVQNILSISVEGAHHPRFKIDTLINLEIPQDYYNNRNNTSGSLHKAVSDFNNSKKIMNELWKSI